MSYHDRGPASGAASGSGPGGPGGPPYYMQPHSHMHTHGAHSHGPYGYSHGAPPQQQPQQQQQQPHDLAASPAPQTVVSAFKRSGLFDAHRKSLLEGFQTSPPGIALAAQLSAILDTDGRREVALFVKAASAGPDAALVGDTAALQAKLLMLLSRAPLLGDMQQAIREQLRTTDARDKLKVDIQKSLDKMRDDARKVAEAKAEKARAEAEAAAAAAAKAKAEAEAEARAKADAEKVAGNKTDAKRPETVAAAVHAKTAVAAEIKTEKAIKAAADPPNGLFEPAGQGMSVVEAGSDQESGEVTESPRVRPAVVAAQRAPQAVEPAAADGAMAAAVSDMDIDVAAAAKTDGDDMDTAPDRPIQPKQEDEQPPVSIVPAKHPRDSADADHHDKKVSISVDVSKSGALHKPKRAASNVETSADGFKTPVSGPASVISFTSSPLSSAPDDLGKDSNDVLDRMMLEISGQSSSSLADETPAPEGSKDASLLATPPVRKAAAAASAANRGKRGGASASARDSAKSNATSRSSTPSESCKTAAASTTAATAATAATETAASKKKGGKKAATVKTERGATRGRGAGDRSTGSASLSSSISSSRRPSAAKADSDSGDSDGGVGSAAATKPAARAPARRGSKTVAERSKKKPPVPTQSAPVPAVKRLMTARSSSDSDSDLDLGLSGQSGTSAGSKPALGRTDSVASVAAPEALVLGELHPGQKVAAFVLVEEDDRSSDDEDGNATTSSSEGGRKRGRGARGRGRGGHNGNGRGKPKRKPVLKESCYQVIVEKYDAQLKLYTVRDCDSGSSSDEDDEHEQMSWQIPRTKIVDYIGLAALSRPFTVGQKVFSLFRDSDDDDEEQTTEFYTAEVVRVLKTGVAVRFEDGDTNISKYTDIFRADDVYGATQ